MQALIDDGLQPHHYCLDYGCGSLRIGEHMIQFLDKCNYIGVDIDREFIDAGVARLHTDVVSNNAPRLRVISPLKPTEINRHEFDVVVSSDVLTHIPPNDVRRFIHCCIHPLTNTGSLYIFFDKSTQIERHGTQSWSYPVSLIEKYVSEHGCELHELRLRQPLLRLKHKHTSSPTGVRIQRLH